MENTSAAFAQRRQQALRTLAAAVDRLRLVFSLAIDLEQAPTSPAKGITPDFFEVVRRALDRLPKRSGVALPWRPLGRPRGAG